MSFVQKEREFGAYVCSKNLAAAAGWAALEPWSIAVSPDTHLHSGLTTPSSSSLGMVLRGEAKVETNCSADCGV